MTMTKLCICGRTIRRYSTPARTRFAPSPTGQLHLGSLRTALYNYLWARKTKGQFIVRVEDTDRKRLVPGAEASLYDNLSWAGLEIDETGTNGPHAPYRQSERLTIYKQHAQTLLDNSSAYRCFCSPERLSSLRESARKNGLSGTYDRKCHHISDAESKQRAADGADHVIRLKTPDTYPVVQDIVHGSVKFHHNSATSSINFDDPVLIKSDGYPTYHLANVVDDHLMQITHVIRGEEWLPSTPKHLALYNAFGWSPPAFCHVPLLASTSGAKLSKRHGDVTVEDYRSRGYLPEALLNYLALMGWNAKVENEVMSLEEMVDRFDLHDITKGAAIVTPEKLHFLQKQHYVRAADHEMPRLVKLTQSTLRPKYDRPDEYVAQVIDALKERVVDPLGLPQLGIYFFEEPYYTSAACTKFLKKFKHELSLDETLAHVESEFTSITSWTEPEFDEKIKNLLHLNIQNNHIMGAIRFAVAGSLSGAGVKQVMSILGRDETLRRIKLARAAL